MGADSRLQPEGRVWRISEQAHSTSSHTALLPTAAHPLLLSALPEGCLSPSVPSTFSFEFTSHSPLPLTLPFQA